MADWSLWARDPDYALNGELRLSAASAVRRWLGVDTAVVTTPHTPASFAKLQPSNGIELYRDGRQEFSGQVADLNPVWDAETGRFVLKASCVGDMQHLADRLSFPDPLRAADDQTVNDYWSFTGTASTGMQQLISDQAGLTCITDRRVPGLLIGADPGVGTSRNYTALFNSVLDQLTLMSVASTANLGVRVHAAAGSLTADIVAPSQTSVEFSTGLNNLVGIDYRIAAPTVTHALTAGQGDLHARMRALSVTTDELALQWGRQIWSYIDRRDTDDVAELVQAAVDAIAQGGPTVSLALTLLDSDAATYAVDWDTGSLVAAFIGSPDGTSVATVTDVVREVAFDVDSNGAEKIRPAIGSFDAKAVIPTPTQLQLSRVGKALAGLIART